MALEFNLIQTLALAAVVSILGSTIKGKIQFFQTYFIPAPVIGGLLFALVAFIGYQTGAFTISLDDTLTAMLLQMFFTATGFSFSVRNLKKSGMLGVKLALLIVILVILQNILAALISPLVGIDPLLGITAGSMSMSGGPGAAAAFGPTIEDGYNLVGAGVAAVAAATAGLVIGSLIGGPVAKFIIKSRNIDTSVIRSADHYEPIEVNDEGRKVIGKGLLSSTLLVLICMGIGTYLVQLLNNLTGFGWPSYVGGLFVAAILTNLFEAFGYYVETKDLDDVGNVSLNVFLTLTVMGLEIWLLLDLALPLIVLLVSQTIFMAIFAVLIIFTTIGKDYDAAVMAAGMCGVGIGSTPNAVANMQAVTEQNGPSPVSMIVLPPVVSIILSIFNPIIISFFIDFLGKM